jgi:hypothetical protein
MEPGIDLGENNLDTRLLPTESVLKPDPFRSLKNAGVGCSRRVAGGTSGPITRADKGQNLAGELPALQSPKPAPVKKKRTFDPENKMAARCPNCAKTNWDKHKGGFCRPCHRNRGNKWQLRVIREMRASGLLKAGHKEGEPCRHKEKQP